MALKKLPLRIIFSVMILLCVVITAGCTSNPKVNNTSEPIETSDCKISVTCDVNEQPIWKNVEVNISKKDFLNKGFVLGDSLDVVFSSGKTYRDVPYVSGTYVRDGTVIVANFESTENIQILQFNGKQLWNDAGLKKGDTVTISLNTTGKYHDLQQINTLSISNNRSDPIYTSDEQFANFRALSGGNIRENLIYRGASPIDNTYQRPSTVDSLLKKYGIKFNFDMADTLEEITQMQKENNHLSPYFDSLVDSGNVKDSNLKINYRSDGYAQNLVEGLRAITAHEGPYYINCLEGKDRTGIASLIIESLAGASYSELETDFMKSYENYFGLTKSSDPSIYAEIKDIKFDDVIRYFTGTEKTTDLSTHDIQSGVIKFLHNGGMTDTEIDAFVKKITT